MTARPLDAIEAAITAAITDAADRLAATSGPRAYTVRQVAERLGVSDTTVRKLIHDGHLPTVPHLGDMRVAAAVLDEFLAGKP